MVQEKAEENIYGDGVAWSRGVMLGKGSFGCVYLATLKNPRSRYSCFPSIMAVKSAEVSVSGSIQKEREIFSNIMGCPNIIECFGEETSKGKTGLMVYNLLLEYGSGGSLADRIKKSGGKGMPELEVRCYTRSILKGLNFIHEIGYVHCDLKPENILLVHNGRGASSEFRAKIGDFGLAKREKQSKKRKIEPYWRGTPMYLSPEAVADNVQERPSDIWALGCIVLQMLTGKPPWLDPNQELSADDVLKKIGKGKQLPKIPNEVSKEAKEFLKGCFVRKSMYRLTAEMLLNHPFIEGLVDDEDDHGLEEFQDVEDINAIKSISMVSQDDDDDDNLALVSEEDSLSYWSDEDDNEIDNKILSRYKGGKRLNVDKESRGVMRANMAAGYDHAIQAPIQVSSRIPSRNAQQCPTKFTIAAGV